MTDLPLPDLSNLTATAILGWYAWYTASRTVPQLVGAFREEMAATREEYRTEREALREEMAAERLQRHADHMVIVEALNALTRRLIPMLDAATSPAQLAIRQSAPSQK